MLINYVIVALRRLLQNPMYSLINIIGLAIGLTCTMLMLVYVQDELSFDTHWQNADRIFRLEVDKKLLDSADIVKYTDNYAGVAERVEKIVPEVEVTSRYLTMHFLVNYKDKSFYEYIRYTDKNFLNIYNIEFVYGDKSSALNDAFSLLISEDIAKKYFGSTNPMGKTLRFDGKHNFIVTGVFRNIDKNTHLNLSMLGNMQFWENVYNQESKFDWSFPFVSTYVLLKPNVPIEQAKVSLASFADKHVPKNLKLNFNLTPVRDIHLAQASGGGKGNLIILSVISLLMLVMACINTVNLTTAKGAERNKELGIRKSLGASRLQVSMQLLIEAVILAFASLIVAVVVCYVVMPWFNSITDKNLSFAFLLTPGRVLQYVGIALLTGILSGAYPAFILSKFKPVEVFRGSSKFGTGSVSIRKLLLVLQFGIAVVLSVFALVIFQQMQYMKNMDLGFDKDNMLVLSNMGWTDIRPNNSALKLELLKDNKIKSVSVSQTVPGKEFKWVSEYQPQGKSSLDSVSLHSLYVDYDFFSTYKVDLKSGRLFNESYGGDLGDLDNPDSKQVNVILTEKAARLLSWDASQAVGKLLKVPGKDMVSLKVVGVVSDFHMGSGVSKLEPYIFMANPGGAQFMTVRIDGDAFFQSVEYVEQIWSRVNPQYPIVRSFLDTDLEESYSRWEKNGQIVAVLVLITIAIAFVGSFGLSAFSIRLRNKEICMRKVVGAGVTEITSLFLWDFSKPILVANLVAIPVAMYLCLNWLSTFPYHINIGVGTLILVTTFSLITCWLAVAYNTLKVANTSPAQTFRHL